jgi:DNA (cytosine-5)-methyltransferase 1
MRCVGLFSGIGGIELGLERAGHQTSLFCEKDANAQLVLGARFPSIPIIEDVTSDFDLPHDADVVAAGFPCQDLSQAGSTRGIKGARSGLIDHVFSKLKRWRVPWVVLENVPFMLHLAGGAGMRHVVEGLERLGYAWAYRVVDARAFGLPQRRERVVVLASRDEDPAPRLFSQDVGPQIDLEVDGHAVGFYWTEGNRGLGWVVDGVPPLKVGSAAGIASPPAIWLPDGRIVTPDIRDAERLQGFPPGWTEALVTAGRAKYRWSLVGNAVAVPVSEWVGRLLTASPSTLPKGGDRLTRDAKWPTAACGSPRGRRYQFDVSSWPAHVPHTPLAEFLREPPKLLSARATAGFLGRLRRSNLRRPSAFDKALQRHVWRMQDAEAKARDHPTARASRVSRHLSAARGG